MAGDVFSLVTLLCASYALVCHRRRTIGGVHYFKLGRIAGSVTFMRKTTTHASL